MVSLHFGSYLWQMLMDFASIWLDDHVGSPYSNTFEYSNEQGKEWGKFECLKVAHSLEALPTVLKTSGYLIVFSYFIPGKLRYGGTRLVSDRIYLTCKSRLRWRNMTVCCLPSCIFTGAPGPSSHREGLQGLSSISINPYQPTWQEAHS